MSRPGPGPLPTDPALLAALADAARAVPGVAATAADVGDLVARAGRRLGATPGRPAGVSVRYGAGGAIVVALALVVRPDVVVPAVAVAVQEAVMAAAATRGWDVRVAVDVVGLADRS